MHSQTRPIDRFIRVLLEEIEGTASHTGDEPFTVAEIYQSLIPYRTHRDRLGVEMNGDYEDTLLRLLAGEGEFLILESDAARARIRNELSQSNPNTGIYREFAAVGVRINPDRTPPPPATSGQAGGAKAPRQGSLQTSLDTLGVEASGSPRKGAAASPSPTADIPSLTPEPSAPASPAIGQSRGAGPRASSVEDAPVSGPNSCPECKNELPLRDSLRFCPHCGTNVLLAPCRECGEVLERSWKFCLSCGTSAR